MKTSSYLIFCLTILLILTTVTGCNQSQIDSNTLPVYQGTQEEEVNSTEFRPNIPEGTEFEAMVYSDPNLRMVIIISHPEWTYEKDRANNQVYFFNQTDSNRNNMISISAVKYEGDAENEAAALWDSQKKFFQSNGVTINNYEQEIVMINGFNPVYSYRFDLHNNVDMLMFQYLYWSWGELMYTCSVSAESGREDEVQGVLDEVLSSFFEYQSEIDRLNTEMN